MKHTMSENDQYINVALKELCKLHDILDANIEVYLKTGVNLEEEVKELQDLLLQLFINKYGNRIVAKLELMAAYEKMYKQLLTEENL